ncbi:MAG: redoxin domain-containing protein [Chloroflexota bacterium]
MTQGRSEPLKAGEPAPDLTLNDTEMKPVRLRGDAGKHIMLAFFPAAFSRVCSTELCAFSEHMAELSEANTQVLGISVDLPYSLKQFKIERKLSFPLLSDFDREAIRAFGIVDDDFKGYHAGVARRSVFVVQPDGAVSWTWVADSPEQQPEYGEVLQHLGAI